MNKKCFGYSLKSIPIPSQKAYMNLMINQSEKFLRAVRWKVYFYKEKLKQGGKVNTGTKNNYGFKSLAAPPLDLDLRQFEQDVKRMVRNLEFYDTIHLNKLQKNMKTDIRSLSRKEELCIEADKNRNFYQVKAKLYNKLIRNEITKEY